MICRSKLCMFLSIPPLAAFFFAQFIYFHFKYNDFRSLQNLEYCVKTHFKNVQEVCASVEGKIITADNESKTFANSIGNSAYHSTTQSGSSIVYSVPSSTFASTTNVTTNSLSSNATPRPLYIRENNPWWSCPEPGKGRKSIFISALIRGRLGNVVWSYLSVLITAKIFGLRPVLDNASVNFLVQNAFEIDHIRMPTIEWMERECNLSGWLGRAVQNENMSKTFYSRSDLYLALENPPKTGLEVYRFNYYVTVTEILVPHFYELKKELVLHKNITTAALNCLHVIGRNFTQYLKSRGLSRTNFEFVGVHVRRTDYSQHMKDIFPLGKEASPKFFYTAMDWLTKELNKSLAFVVMSDDSNWAEINIVQDRKDVFLGGNSDVLSPGVDLAILAACNHTIFAYGTFGLTGALLASRPGGYTIVYDPENGTVTKEMEFASNLPGWRIMTEEGKISYRENVVKYRFYVHPSEQIGPNT